MKKWVFGMVMLLLLAGCTAEPVPAPTPTPEPIVILRPTGAPITTPTPTMTPTPEPTPTPVPTPTPTPTVQERLRTFIGTMTIEEKIGQLCMFGFSGTDHVSSEFAEILKTYRIGNVILYGKNIQSGDRDGGFARCALLTDRLDEAHTGSVPLLISTDVEGGSVHRFQWSKTLESARTLGKKNDTDRAKTEFAYIGGELKQVGINVDLAPVLDISRVPDDHFLGQDKRLFSSDPAIASDLGIACIEGLHEAGVLSVVKHFPGHGAAATDSHEATPVVKKSIDALRQYDLIPFEAAIQGGADGVMVAHILYTAIDSEHVASQSSVFMQGILRDEFGFEGIVMSDDFRMAGLRKQTALDRAAVQFLLAGGDLILCGAEHTYQKKILSGLYEAVQDGTLSEARIDESVYRILEAKMRVTGWQP